MTTNMTLAKTHPASWWVLGSVVAVSASVSQNLISLLALAFFSLVLIGFEDGRPSWSKSLRFYLIIALAVITTRVAFRFLFNFSDESAEPLILLPAYEINLGFGKPVALLGSISAAALNQALFEGLRLASIILGFGLANTLANPKKLLKSTPAVLYPIATSVAIALNLAPQLIQSIQRVRAARKLRGRSSGIGAFSGIVIPALEDAIDNSLALAASMDSRGFGAGLQLSRRSTSLLAFSNIISISLMCIGIYLLVVGERTWLLAIATSIAFGIGSIALTSSASIRTKFNREVFDIYDFLILGFSTAVLSFSLIVGL